MKKFLSYLSLVGFLISFSATALAGTFPDVAQDYKNYEAIQYLSDKAIINGYADGTFGPENSVNRAEAIKIVSNAFSVKHDETYDILFPDVKKEDWFFSYVMGAHKAGLINGYKDGKFKPAANVTLAEFLKIALLASGQAMPTVDGNVFSDVSKEDWYAPYALYARDHNIVLVQEDGKLHAENNLTRGSVAEIIYRTKIVLENNGTPYPLDKNWDLYTGTYLPFKMKYDSKTWQTIENKNEVVFFKPDQSLLQFSHERIYPNSAVVIVTLDKLGGFLDASQYFANMKLVFTGAKYTEFDFHGLKALEILYAERRIVDWYIYLGNSQVLVVYSEFGSGPYGYQLNRFIKAMLSTLEYAPLSEITNPNAQILSDILSKVLVKGTGTDSLNTVTDKVIIETDTIGVGTGPVDYYYSEELNYSFKYERSQDVILDTRSGKTTAF